MGRAILTAVVGLISGLAIAKIASDKKNGSANYFVRLGHHKQNR